MNGESLSKLGRNRPQTLRKTLLLGVAACAILCAERGTANAQDRSAASSVDSEELELIVVTGSRIRGVQAVGSNVIGLARENLIEMGAPSTGDLLRKLPQIVGLGASETGARAQNAAANVTRSMSVNLRGIGSNATLLLLNGRRLPPAGTQGQITDASVIPALGVARFEVVPDGGSAIYGSDAVTGVVNMITRSDFEGMETAGRFGFADGYHEWNIGHIAGFAWDGGNLTATMDYSRHSALKGVDRDFYTSDLRSQGGSDFRSQNCVPGNIVVGGVPYAIPAGGVTPATVGSLTPNTRNLCDNLTRGDIIPKLERMSAMLSLEQEVTSSLSLFAEGYFSRREFVLTDSQLTSNLSVPSANPFYVNPTGGTGPVTVQYDFALDGGLPRNPGFAESWQSVAGFRFDFAQDWQLEGYASYGESADQVSRTQNINTTSAGINSFLANTNPAVAFNPFGPGGTNNPTTIAAVRNGQFVIDGDTSLNVYSVQADGPLFDMPAGSVRIAVGAEYRKEKLNGLLLAGSTTAPVQIPSAADRNIKAIYGELYVPILGEDGGAGRLDLSLAGRYEDYNDFGDTFNPKIGAVWQPLSALSFRGSWGTSFRAPSLAENDARSSGYGLYGDTLPCNHLPPATTCFGIGIAGGNPDLQPEEATTWSLGLDIHPESIPGLRASLTYFDIDYDNQIAGLRGTSGLLTNPVYAPYRTLNPTSQQVTDLLTSGLPINSPINAGLVTYIQDGRRHNVAATVARGFDFDVNYLWDTDHGDFNFGASGAYFTKLKTAAAAGAAFIDVLNTLDYPQRFRVRGTVGWRDGPINVQSALNYVNAYWQRGVTPERKIGSYATVDLHVAYNFDEAQSLSLLRGVSLAIDVANLFDQDPPFVNLAGGHDPQTANPIGRRIAFSVRKAW